jgi:uncharacterized membrane protein YfcA
VPVEVVIVPLSLLAFFVKGVAGFGPGIVLVPLGALLFGVPEMVVVMAFLDLLSNVVMFCLDRGWRYVQLWLPLVITAVAGSVTGAVLLVFLPGDVTELVLGATLLPLAVWMLLANHRRSTDASTGAGTRRVSGNDLFAAGISGCAGGLVGITGPVLAATLARRYGKLLFRRAVVPVFLFSALARVVTFGASGAISGTAMLLVLLALPGLAVGLVIGNRLFQRIPELWFRRLLGGLIALAGVRLLS